MSNYREYVRRNRARIESSRAEIEQGKEVLAVEDAVPKAPAKTSEKAFSPLWTTSESSDRRRKFNERVSRLNFWYHKTDHTKVMARTATEEEHLATPDGYARVNPGEYIVCDEDLTLRAVRADEFLKAYTPAR